MLKSSVVKKSKKFINRLLSSVLSASIIVGSIPVFAVNAADDEIVKPSPESEGDRYNPEFSYDEDYYNKILDGVKDIKDIGKLPTYEEFVEETGYVSSATTIPSLTDFRKIYGTGADFREPESPTIICITNESELDLLSSLVNKTADGETDAEQVYYSTGSYTLSIDIAYTGTRYQPIGTEATPFNGTFNGGKCEISGVTISGDKADSYQSTQYFGIFGYIGVNGKVKNLGVTKMTINLPYTVGADVGVISGRNYGEITDCYINGKFDTRVTVSNATVGGISAENYGIIKNTYSDFWADVSVTTGSYSEPQPITSVNNGTVENSYYIKWENKNNKKVYTTDDDDGKSEYLVGWKSNDYSGFYGTGVSDVDLANLNGIENTNFSKGTIENKDIEYAVGKEYTITDFIDKVGTGDSFDIKKAKAITNAVPANKLSILGIDEWNEFVSLVNHTAENETDEEQQFYANAYVHMGGQPDSYGWYYIPRSYEYMSFPYYDREPLGTQQYPFNGTIDGNGVRLVCDLSYDSETGTSSFQPAFGVIGKDAKIFNIKFDFDNAYVTGTVPDANGSAFCNENNGNIHDCLVFGDVNAKSDEAVSMITRNVYSFALKNNGVIKNCRSILHSSYDANEYCNAIKENTGTVDNLEVKVSTESFNNIGTLNDNCSTAWDSAQPFEFDSLFFNADFLVSYPELNKISSIKMNEDGKYLISTPDDLMYFIKYGRGEELILTNTIDMSSMPIKKEYTGSFSLDGTLTDENDICSYIDLGVKKCYGILNLSFENYGISSGNVDISNVYFIGGTFFNDSTKGSYDNPRIVNVYGDKIDNVHSSMNYDIVGSYCDIRSAQNAINSSYSGAVELSGYRIFLHCVGYTSDYCVTYAGVGTMKGHNYFYGVGYDVKHSKSYVDMTNASIAYNADIYGLGFKVNSCLIDKDFGKNGFVTTNYYRNSYHDHDRFLFGSDVTDSVFRGSVSSNVDFGVLNGFVFDTNGVINGSFSGLYGDNILFKGTINTTSSNDVAVFNSRLMRRYSEYPDSSTYPDGDRFSSMNVINDGVINVTLDGSSDEHHIYGMGSYVDGKMHGRINVIGSFQNCDKLYIHYYGSGQGQNYSDVNYDNTSCRIGGVSVFTSCSQANYIYKIGDESWASRRSAASSFVENYGKMNVVGNMTYSCVSDGVFDVINYADINVTGDVKTVGAIASSCVETFCSYGGWSGLTDYANTHSRYIKNYGNVNVSIYSCRSCSNEDAHHYFAIDSTSSKYSFALPSIVNYGDVTVQGTSKYSTFSGLLNVNGCGGGTNYGDVYVHDLIIHSSSSYGYISNIYGGSLSSYGSVTFENVDSSGRFIINSVIRGSNFGYTLTDVAYDERSKYDTSNIYTTGNITVKNCTGAGTYDISPIRTVSDSSVTKYGENPQFVINGVMDLSDSNMGYSTMRVYGIMMCDGASTGKSLPSLISCKNNVMNISGINCSTLKISGFSNYDYSNAVANGIKSIILSDIDTSSLYVNGVSASIYNKGLVNANFCNIDIQNTRVRSYASINGVSEYLTALSGANFGTISLDLIDHCSSLDVSGVSSYISFDKNCRPSFINASNITIEAASSYMNASGVGGNDILFNAINTGDVTVEQGYSNGITHVAGLSAKSLNYAQSVINWGDITVSGVEFQQSTEKSNMDKICVAAIADIKHALCSFINYGDVTVNGSYKDDTDESNACFNLGLFTASTLDDSVKYTLDFNTPDDFDTYYAIDSGLNYGNFNISVQRRHNRSFGDNVDFNAIALVDLSGNPGLIDKASCRGRYSTVSYDNSGKPFSTSDIYYEMVREGHNPVLLTTYNTILDPTFVFRSENVYETKYLTVSSKSGVNNRNCFEYTDIDQLCGKTAEFIREKYPDAAGAYVLVASYWSNKSPSGYVTRDEIGVDVEDAVGNLVDDFTDDFANVLSEEINTHWGKVTIQDFVIKYLNQRNKETWPEVNKFSMTSIDTYPTEGGVSLKLSDKSYLIAAQEQLDCYMASWGKVLHHNNSGDEYYTSTHVLHETDREGYFNVDSYYSYHPAPGDEQHSTITFLSDHFYNAGVQGVNDKDTLVTVIDAYMPVSGFSIAEGEMIDYDIDIEGGQSSTFKPFKTAIVENDNDALINRIKKFYTDNIDIKKITTGSTVSIPMKNVGDTVYALIGAVWSENNKRTNLVALRLHSIYSVPTGCLTSFSYPQSISTDGATLVNKDAFDDDSYTEELGVQSTKAYGDIEYPVYKLTEPMIYSTDGAAYFYYGKLYSRITNTGNIKMSFDLRNTLKYKVRVSGNINGHSYDQIISEDMMSITPDGTATISSIDNFAVSGTNSKISTDVYHYYDSNDCTNTYNYEYNPFFSGGSKTVTVYSVLPSGEEIVAFQVQFEKAKSHENYIKGSVFNCYDYLHANNPASRSFNPVLNAGVYGRPDISDYYAIKTNLYYALPYSSTYGYESFSSSTLSSHEQFPSYEYSDYYKYGDYTYYPTHKKEWIDVTAENGDRQEYSYIYDVNKIPVVSLTDLRNSNSSIDNISGSLYVMPENTGSFNLYAYYNTNQIRFSGGYMMPVNKVLVYLDGEFYDTATTRLSDQKYSSLWNCIVWNGIVFNPNDSTSSASKLHVYTNSDFDASKLPEGILTFKPVMELGRDGDEVFTIECADFSISTSLLKDHRAISAKWNKALVTSTISTKENELSNDVDIYGNGVIDYTLTPDETNQFYITNSVEPNCTGSDFAVEIPKFATVEEWNGSAWVKVFTATGVNTTYKKHFNYTSDQLLDGYKYNFRVLAQDYKSDDNEKKTHVSYYNTLIVATIRNKDISIDFKDTDATTMALYDEIIQDKGNLAIQIKNMNGEDAIYQQTKFYTGRDNMDSTFYKLSQGDFAIDVQVPKGYLAKVRIVGGSTEGYLVDSPVVKGKRIRLPYANAQDIKLEVYLERDKSYSNNAWGVSSEKSFYKSDRSNNI